MQKLVTMHDQVVGKPYHLYRMKADEIVNRVRNSYPLPKDLLQTFNSDSGIAENIIRIKGAEARGGRRDEYGEERLKEAIERIEKNQYVDKMGEIGIHFGLELMPIVVAAKGDFENPNTKVELVDGFKRTFCLEETPSVDILVKVYEPLDDAEWINAMILYNSWKFEDSRGANTYMDRGFQLGLYHRYDMLLTDFIPQGESYYTLIDLYTNGGALGALWREGSEALKTYQTYWNNACFHEDLKMVYHLFNLRPSFTVQKQKKTETITPDDAGYNYRSLERILKIFVEVLGQIRRYEHQEGITERKPLDIRAVEAFLADEQYQKTLHKVVKMTVDGHVVNNLIDIRQDAKVALFASMGYQLE